MGTPGWCSTALTTFGRTLQITVLCFASQLSRKEWHLSLSLYKLTATMTCSITELSSSEPTAYLPFPLDN